MKKQTPPKAKTVNVTRSGEAGEEKKKKQVGESTYAAHCPLK
jgi:hypothetical protein